LSPRRRTLAIVLAGGEGRRLAPLTRDCAKPALPFGGQYRVVDFALSNLVNAGFLRIIVLTQYKSQLLAQHIARAWPLSSGVGQYIATVPAQMQLGPQWFSGSADAIYQNLELIRAEAPDHVAVFGADHVYRMNADRMLEAHVASGAGVTVAGLRVPAASASEFGVIKTGPGGVITNFFEKPTDPLAMFPGRDTVVASMGNYMFRLDALVEAVSLDAAQDTSGHDLGGDIIPHFVANGQAHLFDFDGDIVPGQREAGRGYWRDVGTIDSYYEANMDLVAVEPRLNLYNQEWPIYTHQEPLPPAKTVHESAMRSGLTLNSLLSGGVIVSGSTVRNSILGPKARVHSRAIVEDSILMHGVEVGAGSVVRRAIIDRDVELPPGTQIGVDAAADAARFTVSEGGVVVVGARDKVLHSPRPLSTTGTPLRPAIDLTSSEVTLEEAASRRTLTADRAD
jgi:glucose-1-phosphate adenylyltransferase